MVKISNSSYENEIHRVDSPFNEDSKNIIFFGQGSPNVGGGTAGKFRKNDQNLEKPIVMQIREWSIQIGNTDLYSQVPKSSHCFGFPVTDSILNCNFLKPFVTLNTENTEIMLCTNFSCQNQCVFIVQSY